MSEIFIPPKTRAELANPAPAGSRHEQAKRLSFSLIGQGLTPSAVFEQLRAMYVLRDEQERFFDTKVFPEQDLPTEAASVKQLRAAIRIALPKLEKDRAARVKALHAKYDLLLAQAQAQLTKAKRIDDALEVKAKRGEIAAAWLTGIPAVPPQPSVPSVPTGGGAAKVKSATKERPYVNSLGMKFVPVPGTKVLFSVWETRLKDFEEFVQRSGYDMGPGQKPWTLEPDADAPAGVRWKQAGGDWRDPHFPAGAEQNGEHPVVCVSLYDAKAFCDWLTARERELGLLPAGAHYAVPTDEQWSVAAGKDKYPWGNRWPPRAGDGNYAGEESRIGNATERYEVIEGLKDGYAWTSPVGKYRANEHGLHDMGGNVWEHCDTAYRRTMNSDEARKTFPFLEEEKAGDGIPYYVIRGGSWFNTEDYGMRSLFRYRAPPVIRGSRDGFRCVLVISGG